MNISVQDELNAADLDQIVSRLVEAQALSYGKLFDLRGAKVELIEDDLRAHAGRLSAYSLQSAIGALAVVVDAATQVDASVLAALAAAGSRPCRVFLKANRATNWLRLQR